MPAEETIYLSFAAEITDRSARSLTTALARCADSAATDVCLLLATPGGSVSAGIYLHNMLRGLPFKLTVHNVGDVDSIGTAVFLAADQRYACPASKFMLHGISRSFGPIAHQVSLTAEELQWALLNVTADEDRIAAIIGQRSTLIQAEIADMFRQQRRLTAAEAVTAGLVHQIQELRIPPGSLIITVDPDD